MAKKKNAKERFIRAAVSFDFKLTLKPEDIEEIVSRAIENGIGDWVVINKATRTEGKSEVLKLWTLPIELADITTGMKYTVTVPKFMVGLSQGLIDFPHVLNTKNGYNIDVRKLTQEDIDEIFQLAVFGEMKYKYV